MINEIVLPPLLCYYNILRRLFVRVQVWYVAILQKYRKARNQNVVEEDERESQQVRMRRKVIWLIWKQWQKFWE